jgi:hypothetical protein
LRLTLTQAPRRTIGIPAELADALGRPEEIEAEVVPEGVLLRTGSRTPSRPGTFESIEAYLESLESDVGFTEEEEAAFRSERKQLAHAENERVRGLFGNEDLPA